MRRRVLAPLTALLMLLAFAWSATPAKASGPTIVPRQTRFLSVLVGRGTAFEAVGCRLAPGAVNVLEVAAWSHQRGVSLSSNLVPNYMDTTGHRFCQGSIAYQTAWDAKQLADKYGSRHITSGMGYKVLTTLTHDEQVAEVCGARDYLEGMGFTSVTGMYAPATPYTPGEVTDEIVNDVIKPCGFKMTRDYGSRVWPYQPMRADGTRVRVNVEDDQNPAGYHRVLSVNGGSCPTTWVCGDGGDRHYMQPAELIRDLHDAPAGSHMMLQIYRVVRGNVPGKWTCDGPNHATYAAEVYCYSDYQRFINNIPDDVVVADPLTVANTWKAEGFPTD